LSYCPDLLLGEGSFSPKPGTGDHASIEVAASSAKSISDIISFAELVSVHPEPYQSLPAWLTVQIDAKAVIQPWADYPLYLAARAFRERSSRAIVVR
jgi:hypothetical protein